jgi:hypothetical protein
MSIGFGLQIYEWLSKQSLDTGYQHFTNINKAKKHLSPLSLNEKKITTYDVGNLGPILGQTYNAVGLMRLMGPSILLTGSQIAIHL